MGSVDGEEAVTGPSGQEGERILVSVRMRPLNEKEASRNEPLDWECINNTTIVYKNQLSLDRSVYPTSYTFDRVFGCDCSTRQVYEKGAKAVVLSVVSGINSSVFAYGQTSSGKTYTMSGITEYTMEEIFDYIQQHKEREFQLKFSAMEIYNESVRDLLTTDNSPLRLLDDPERGTVVEKLTEETLRDRDHFKELLAVCQAQRQIGETFLNEASSRSHQILRLAIESSTREFVGVNNSSTLAATLNFVDLAGSERASQALSAGSRLKEGSHINRSLLTLGTVIRKLSKGGIGHIPYRDSKLTRILQSSLGGNARTAIICTMSPARTYAEKSRNTLLFASCAKEVATNARVNVVMSDKALVKHLQRELARLETELRNANPSVKAVTTDLLREKDLKIEELEGRLRELTVELDNVRSLIRDLQQQVHQYKDSSDTKLQAQQASKDSPSDATAVAEQKTFDVNYPAFEVPQSPERHSRPSYDGSCSISDFEENYTPSSPSEQTSIEESSEEASEASSEEFSSVLFQSPSMGGHEPYDDNQAPKQLIGQAASCFEVGPFSVLEEAQQDSMKSYETDPHQASVSFQMPVQHTYSRPGGKSPYFVEFDPYELPREIECQTFTSSEACQIQCSESSAEKDLGSDKFDNYRTAEAISKQTDQSSEDYWKEVPCANSEMDTGKQANTFPHEQGQSFLLMGYDSIMCEDDEPKKESIKERDVEPEKKNVLSNMNPSLVQGSRDQSDEQQKEGVIDEQKKEGVIGLDDSNSTSSISDRSNDMSSTSSSFFEKVKYDMKNESEEGSDEVIVRLDDVSRNLPDAKNEAPQIGTEEIEFDGIPLKDIEVSNHIKDTVSHILITETKETTTEPQSMKHLPNSQGDDEMHEAEKPIKKMKDIGLNPRDDLETNSLWLLDSEALQTAIFDLWDACHVSLVHRTRFFLLFINGNRADTIYMEVERRRVSFVMEAFHWGKSAVLDGQKLTPVSSMRSLYNEREMLERLIKKRFPKRERINLYIKWNISLDSKRRSSQLAHRLWTKKVDMDHITESANLVAKLVRFSEPKVPKEAFGLNLTTNLRRRKSYR